MPSSTQSETSRTFTFTPSVPPPSSAPATVPIQNGNAAPPASKPTSGELKQLMDKLALSSSESQQPPPAPAALNTSWADESSSDVGSSDTKEDEIKFMIEVSNVLKRQISDKTKVLLKAQVTAQLIEKHKEDIAKLEASADFRYTRNFIRILEIS